MNRRILLVVIAVVLALTGTVVVYAYVKKADDRALADIKSANVLIVQRPIAAGTSWDDVSTGGFVKRETVPSTTAPVDAITSVNAVIDKTEVATAVIQPGQVLVRQMFNSQALVTGVLPIPKGMIAISVSLSGVADVAGYVQPQSQVAIFTTFKVSGDAAKKLGQASGIGGTDLSTVKLLLSNVRVIATTNAAPTDVAPATGGRSSGGSILTLALNQQDAQKVILAQQIGSLYLGLLSKDSKVSTSEPGTTNYGHINLAPIILK
jgi:pilus assembly protein CpaB